MIQTLRVQNFRSYKDSSFELGELVNIVVGPNASGKTNLLEAVLVLCRGKSFRTSLPGLVRLGKNWARLDGGFGKSDRTLKISEAGSLFIINNQENKRLPRTQILPVVLFEPNHLQLITGDPSRRRDWIDGFIENINPAHKKLLSSYSRTLAQRNQLLKHPPTDIKRQIFAWDIRLSELASAIVSNRIDTIEKINKSLSKPYSHIAGRRQAAATKYLAGFPAANYSSNMLKKLGQNLDIDIARGFTSSGPHREDLKFFLNGQPISETASRGETRSLMITLKILEKDFLQKVSQQKPLMLLDDIFSELDGARRHALVEYLKDCQSIITTTDADSAIAVFGKKHNLIPLL